MLHATKKDIVNSLMYKHAHYCTMYNNAVSKDDNGKMIQYAFSLNAIESVLSEIGIFPDYYCTYIDGIQYYYAIKYVIDKNHRVAKMCTCGFNDEISKELMSAFYDNVKNYKNKWE